MSDTPKILTNDTLIFTIDYLLQYSKADNYIFNAIIYAIDHKDIEAIERMLSIQHHFTQERYREIIVKIIELHDFGLFKKAYDYYPFTQDSSNLNHYLQRATLTHNEDIWTFLLDNGADGSLENKYLLHNAMMNNNLPFVQFMIQHYQLNFQEDIGELLLLSMRQQQFAFIEYFITHGARISVYSSEELKTIPINSLEYARQTQEKIVQYLQMNQNLSNPSIHSQPSIKI